ncbi:MAG: 3-oxoacyl-ACP reductase [Desulfatibacillaceae bacterium]
MGDRLLEISRNDMARNIIKGLGLPLPLPQPLDRADGPWDDQPLMDYQVAVGHAKKSELGAVLARTLPAAGAWCLVSAGDKVLRDYQEHGDAWGRIPKAVANDGAIEGARINGIVFDATGMSEPADLFPMYEFVHTKMRALARCGRVIMITRPWESIKDPAGAAAARGVEGFTRCVGKEVGKLGATANVVTVEKGAEDRLEPVLRFFLSKRSAYVSGQPINVTADTKAPEAPVNIRPLDGKSALVTGAAQGIGKEIARTLAREGARVICMDLPNSEDLTAQLARDIGGTALHHDITADDAARVITEHVKQHHNKKLDIIVNNAGVTRDKMLKNMDEQRWNMAIEINLRSVIRVTDDLLKLMPADGRIVCLASIAGIAGNVGQANYGASKAGIIALVKTLAPTLAKKGICANAVAPGFIETRMTAAIPFATREAGRRLSSLSQGGLPEDVAEVVCFLSSPQASGINGEVIRICGQNFLGA